MKIKVFFNKVKNRILISEIWDDVKQYIRDNLNMGNIVEVIDRTQERNYTCPKGFPSEYYSKKNLIETYVVKTDMGNIIAIVQKYLGLNFESAPDEQIFVIADENNEVLYDSSVKEDNKKHHG